VQRIRIVAEYLRLKEGDFLKRYSQAAKKRFWQLAVQRTPGASNRNRGQQFVERHVRQPVHNHLSEDSGYSWLELATKHATPEVLAGGIDRFVGAWNVGSYGSWWAVVGFGFRSTFRCPKHIL
jgi:hypothetical protein